MTARVTLGALSRALLLGGVAMTLGACSLFSSSNAPKPAPLENITPSLQARVAWEARVDSVKFPLTITAVNDPSTLSALPPRVTPSPSATVGWITISKSGLPSGLVSGAAGRITTTLPPNRKS